MRPLRLALISLVILAASYFALQLEAMSGVRSIVGAVLKGIGVGRGRPQAASKEIRLSMEDEPPLLRGASSRMKKATRGGIASDRTGFEIISIPVPEGDIPPEPFRLPAFERSDEPSAPEAETSHGIDLEAASDQTEASLWQLLEEVLPEDIPRPTDGDLTELFYDELEELMGIPEEIGRVEVDEEGSCWELMRMLAPDLSEEEIDLILRLGGSGLPAGRASSDEEGKPGL